MGSWLGSKATSGLCQPIIALMPPHDTYIETHLGGGAIMQRKPPVRRNIGIDLDARALERFACGYAVEKIHGCAHQFLAEYPFMGRELVYIPHIGTNSLFLNAWKFSVSRESSSFLCVVWVWFRQSVIAFRNASKSA